MKFLAGIALFAAAVAANPISTTVAATPSSSPSPSPSTFKLRVSQDAGSSTKYNNYFIGSRETAALSILNSQADFDDAADAANFAIRNGTVYYQAPNHAPWKLVLKQSEETKAPVQIDVSPSSGSTAFNITKGKLLSKDQNFGGFLACDNDDVYWRNSEYGNTDPANCEGISLYVQWN